MDDDEEAANPGSNLFVTGIHPRLTEEEIQRLFEKYGDVEKCNIMRDPHTRESRGFGFVKMVTSDQADAAKNGLQGEVYEGRTLSIEKARRAKPRTPTPGKYFGPPKRGTLKRIRSYSNANAFVDDRPRRGFGGGDRYGDRYDDRRGYGRRDDYAPRGGRGYGGGDRYGDDRGYSRRDRDEYAPRSYRDDRYSSRGDDRRGGGGGGYGYDRPPRAEGGSGYGDAAAPPAEGSTRGGSGRGYDDRGGDRYDRR